MKMKRFVLLSLLAVLMSLPSDAATRDQVLKQFCGSYSYVAPGATKTSITWVYNLQLDPVNSSCRWVEDGFVFIENAKGWCGTVMMGAEAWEVTSFQLHNSLKYAIVTMEQVDQIFLDGPAHKKHLCTLKLTLDSFSNIRMSFVKGNSAPAVLCDSRGRYTKTAKFVRD